MKVIAIFSVMSGVLVKVVGPFHSYTQIASYLEKHKFVKRYPNSPYQNAPYTERATVWSLEAP